MKRRLFNIAWSIVDQFDSFSQALVHAWKTIKLQLALCLNSLVSFKYKKASDGSIREANGSNASLSYIHSDKPKPVNHGILVYFDLDAKAFRSAKVENIIF